ncbi:hypothetical protein Bca4012_026390 [Brassica carinata]
MLVIIHLKPQPLNVSLLLFFSSPSYYFPLKCSYLFNSGNQPILFFLFNGDLGFLHRLKSIVGVVCVFFSLLCFFVFAFALRFLLSSAIGKTHGLSLRDSKANFGLMDLQQRSN